MTIDPRLADRRREVAEDHAKRNVTRLLRFFAVLTAVGAIVWFALSPFMSVARVTTGGVVASEVESILDSEDVVPGTPMIMIRVGNVEEAIETDPWVVSAEVQLSWPNDVLVRVEERVPRAWVETSDGWVRRSVDGGAVPGPAEPDNTLGWVRLPLVTPSEAEGSELVLGAIEFLESLPVELASVTSVRLENGELWAVVDGYQVRLGRAAEMRAKAISLVALMTENIPKTSTLVLIAPDHPAVSPVGANTGTPDE